MNQPRRPIFSVIHLLLLLALFSLLFVQSEHFADDPGVGWHIATGDYIRAQLSVPRVDPFLHSLEPRSWVADQWLPDLLLSFAFSLGGWGLIHAALTVVFLAPFFLVLYPFAVERTTSPIAAATAILFAFKIAQIHYILRPVVISFLLFSIFLVLLEKLGQALQEDRPLGKSLLLPLFVLFIIWSNSHGSFVLGLIAILLLPLRAVERRGSIRQVAQLFLVAFLGTLLNPYFLGLHTSVFSLGNSDFFMSLHEEWRSPSFRELEGKLSELSVIILIVAHAFYSAGRSGPASLLTPFELALLVLFGHLGLQSVRMLPYFGMVIVVPLTRAISSLGAAAVGRLRHELPGFVTLVTALQQREERGGAPVVSMVAVAAMLMILSVLGFVGPAPSVDRYPYEGITHLTQLKDRTVVVAPPEWGGFITLQGEGRVKPVIDDRNTLLGEDFYRQYLSALRPQGDWCGFARSLGAEYFLLPADSGLTYSMRSDSKVRLLHQDSVSVLFRLKGGKHLCDKGKAP